MISSGLNNRPNPLANTMEQPPVQIGQYVLGKNLGIGAFGKVRYAMATVDGLNAVIAGVSVVLGLMK